MSKYSYELKLKMVQAYLNKEGGYRYLTKKFGIPHKSYIEKWVNAYRVNGAEGLLPKTKNKIYPLQMKKDMVQLYKSTNLSMKQISNEFNLSENILASWLKIYNDGGFDNIPPDVCEFETMKKQSNRKPKTVAEANDIIKKLEEENLELRIKNEYLKELRRLREAEANQPLNVFRKLSVISEDTLN